MEDPKQQDGVNSGQLTPDEYFYHFAVIAIREFNVPLYTINKISRLSRAYAELSEYRIARSKYLHKKYIGRLHRAAWRKIIHYPIAKPAVKTFMMDSSQWETIGDSILIRDDELRMQKLAMVTTISFVATKPHEFTFYYLAPHSGELMRLTDFKVTADSYVRLHDGIDTEVEPKVGVATPAGRYRVNIDMRMAPIMVTGMYFTINVCNFDCDSEYQIFDNAPFVKCVTHIGYSYEVPAKLPMELPYAPVSIDELNLRLNLYAELCRLIYSRWAQKVFRNKLVYEESIAENNASYYAKKIRDMRCDSKV